MFFVVRICVIMETSLCGTVVTYIDQDSPRKNLHYYIVVLLNIGFGFIRAVLQPNCSETKDCLNLA